MLVQIDRSTAAGLITAERAEALGRTVRAALQNLQDRLSNTLRRGTLSAAETAALGHAEGVRAAATAAGRELDVTFADVPERALELMQQRRDEGIARNFQTLIGRHLQGAARQVDRYLSSAIGRGITYDAAGKELAALLARGDETLLETLRQVGPRGGRLRQGILGTDVSELPDIEAVRTLLFDARRIVITEMNTSFHESNRLAAAESPVVDLVRWTLSARHDGLPSSPDVCTVYAESDLHGYGPGLFHPASAPPHPHPFCACTLASITLPPERWGEERPLPDVEQPSAEQMERELQRLADQGSRTVTPAFAERQARMASGLVRADRVAR
jgi:hypothetical protein